MAGRKRRRAARSTLAWEIGIGAALLVGILTIRLVPEPVQAAQLAAVAGSASALAVWLRQGLQRRATGPLLALGVGVLLYAGWTLIPAWSPARPLEASLLVALGILALWLLRPLTVWLRTSARATVNRTLRRINDRRADPLRRTVPRRPRTGDARAAMSREELQRLSPRAFEELCARLAEGWGYRSRVVGEAGDGGIDVELWRDGEYAVAQCKRYRGTVPVGKLRDFYGAMMHVGAVRGYFFTSGRFTRGGRDFIEGKPIELLDGAHLERLLVERARARE